METYDPDSSEDSLSLITHVAVESADKSDAHALLPAIEKTKDCDMVPDELLADSLYGSDDNCRQAKKEHGVDVVSPVMGRAGKGLVLDDFTLDVSGKIIACPEGHSPVRVSHKKRFSTAFNVDDCRGCPQQEHCPVKPGKKAAYYRYSAKDVRLSRRRTWEQTEEFQDKYRFRAGVEATMSEYDRRTGVAGPDELYRWETQFARDRQVVLRAESNTLDAMQNMNRILNRPVTEEFIAEETDLSDPLLVAGDTLFFHLMSRPRYLTDFRSLAVAKGLEASPELKLIDSQIEAQKRIMTASKREFWLPTFSVEGDVDQLFSSAGEGQRDKAATGLDDTDWMLGVYARLPLIEGGRKFATLKKTREDLQRLELTRQAGQERITQVILAAINIIRASYPSISLSREAAESARKNLQLVTDSYVQGIKSIIDLLDAQSQALTADLDASNAVYNFLIDQMGLQRSMGTFITFLPDEERQQWKDQLSKCIQ